MNRNLNVIEHTDGVADGVIAYRVDGHLADLHATHGTVHADRSFGFRTKGTTGLVGGLVHVKRRLFDILTLVYGTLARHQRLHVVVSKTIVRSTIARDFDTRSGTERNSDKLIKDGKLGLTHIAAKDGVGNTNPREGSPIT